MDIVGKDITFACDGVVVDTDGREIAIPAGTRLVIDRAVIKDGQILLSVHKEDENGKR